jgi:hypothetical protein
LRLFQTGKLGAHLGGVVVALGGVKQAGYLAHYMIFIGADFLAGIGNQPLVFDVLALSDR